MKIGFTINLGDDESMRIDLSEFDNPEACIDEISRALLKSNIPKVMEFRRALLK